MHIFETDSRWSPFQTENDITVYGGKLWINPRDIRILCPCVVCAVCTQFLHRYVIQTSIMNDQSLWILDLYIEIEHTVHSYTTQYIILSNGNSV